MSSNLPYDLFKVTALRCVLVSPHMMRLTIDCSALPQIRPTLAAQWLKVYVPQPDSSRSVGRAYTVRRYDNTTHELDLDFFLHGDTGPIGSWASRVKHGDQFEISELRSRSGFNVADCPEKLVLFGDETALPAIASILEVLPEKISVRAYVSIDDALEEGYLIGSPAANSVTWIHRTNIDDEKMQQAAAASVLEFGNDARFWIAGESGVVKATRARLLEEGVERSLIDSSGYWKRGQADHRDD
ncbi:siderophore-interacting protein [Comamonas testosteroni]|uniref:siderophore-interacting protein n=1 Tax=Comamonas testosteroni TaxID=285 RepID=UPI00389AC095